jgi:outer membrane protein TolC
VGSEGGYDLQKILDVACRQSPKLAVQRAKVTESQMRALATGLLPNPEVEGGLKKVTDESDGSIFGINQELPVNGALGLERQSALILSNAERIALSREVQKVLAEVESAFVDVLSSMELSAVEEQGLAVASHSLKLVSDSLKAGLVASLPFYLAKGEEAGAKTAYLLAQKEVQLAQESLAALLGMKRDGLPPIQGTLHLSLIPPGLSMNGPRRTDLQAANLRIQAAQVAVSAADRARIPNPKIGYSREESGGTTENYLTIGMEIPVFNNGRPLVGQRMAEQQVLVTEKNELAKSIDADIAQAVTQLEARQEAVRIYESEVQPSIEQSLAAAEGAFQTGTTDMSLLLQTQSRLLENKRNTVRALKDLRKAEIVYLLAIGAMRER